jgi:hypothetical protein
MFAAIYVQAEEHDDLHSVHSHANIKRTQIRTKTKVTKQNKVTLYS